MYCFIWSLNTGLTVFCINCKMSQNGKNLQSMKKCCFLWLFILIHQLHQQFDCCLLMLWTHKCIMGFEPHSGRRVVSLSKTYLPPKVLVIPRKQWLRPNMTEKLFTRTLSIKPNQTKTNASCLNSRSKLLFLSC